MMKTRKSLPMFLLVAAVVAAVPIGWAAQVQAQGAPQGSPQRAAQGQTEWLAAEAAASPLPVTGAAEQAQQWSSESAHMLGLSTVMLATGAVVGIRFGGFYGGVAGSLFGGAAMNAIRAYRTSTSGTPDGKKEALISGTYAIVSAGLGGYLWYIGSKKRAGAAT